MLLQVSGFVSSLVKIEGVTHLFQAVKAQVKTGPHLWLLVSKPDLPQRLSVMTLLLSEKGPSTPVQPWLTCINKVFVTQIFVTQGSLSLFTKRKF